MLTTKSYNQLLAILYLNHATANLELDSVNHFKTLKCENTTLSFFRVNIIFMLFFDIVMNTVEFPKWLFLLKHKLELMFSSIDPCTPLTCDFLGINFPPLELQTCILSRAPLLSANQRFLRMCFLITSQSAPSCFYCSCASRPIAVDLHSQFSSCSTRAFISPPTLHFHLAFPGVTILRRSSLHRCLCFICLFRYNI